MDDMDLIWMVEAWAALRKRVTIGSIIRAFRCGSRKAEQLFNYMIIVGDIDPYGRVTLKGEQNGSIEVF